MTIARHLCIRGRVQGVFFRAWAVGTARDLGLSGWVRNLPDGTVEAFVQGEEPIVERFVALARQGPPRAQVEHIEIGEREPNADLDGFSQKPSP